MPEFKYRHKGSANDDWNEDTIEAENEQDAQTKLDEIYGIERDEMGAQLNGELIKVEILNK